MLNSGLKRTGVLGCPVEHSLSPLIHHAAYCSLGLTDWHYQKLPVPVGLFGDVVRALPQVGFVGANVTIPHKKAALEVADEASAEAKAIGAANTLLFQNRSSLSSESSIFATNTDALGTINALPFSIVDRSAVVLGAGGSARAAVWSLLNAGAKEVMVWNRNFGRAQGLCQELGGTPVKEEIPAVDLLVNCTPIGMKGREEGESIFDLPFVKPGDLTGYGCVMDFVYHRSGTLLIDMAQKQGVLTVDGFEILVRQGALSFELWTGLKPSLEVMRGAIEEWRLRV